MSLKKFTRCKLQVKKSNDILFYLISTIIPTFVFAHAESNCGIHLTWLAFCESYKFLLQISLWHHEEIEGVWMPFVSFVERYECIFECVINRYLLP